MVFTTTTTVTGLAKLKLKHLSVVFRYRPLYDINRELEPYKQAGLVASITYPLKACYSAFSGLPHLPYSIIYFYYLLFKLYVYAIIFFPGLWKVAHREQLVPWASESDSAIRYHDVYVFLRGP